MADDLIFIIVFMIAVLFQAFYIKLRGEGIASIVFGLVTALAWIICGPVFILAEPNFTSVAMLFTSLGLINVLFVFLSVFHWLSTIMFRKRRRGDLFE